jgi:hypothetical protein
LVAYGYRLGEVLQDKIGLIKAACGIKYSTGRRKDLINPSKPERRPPMLASLGVHCFGVLFPHPDVCDHNTKVAGAEKRACAAVPAPEPLMLAEWMEFVEDHCKTNFVPLSPGDDVSFWTWIENVNQPLSRKVEYTKAFEEVSFLVRNGLNDMKEIARVVGELRLAKLGGFGKREMYAAFKYMRCINARNDKYKTLSGPIFKAIERVVFSQPDFIKKIPVKDRPRYIIERLYQNGGLYGMTDFSRFEAAFIKEVQLACEFVLFIHMTQFLNEGKFWQSLVTHCQLEENKIDYQTFQLFIFATRMSGEMCTSLANGFSNNMILKFLAKKQDIVVVPINEGDDGIFWCSAKYDPDSFAKLGFEIKIDYTNDLAQASFCGMIFDMETYNVITDPIKVLCNFGWTDAKYVKATRAKKMKLLRSKALSMLYEYPGCPIIQPLAIKLLSITAGFDIKRTYDKERDWHVRRRLHELSIYYDGNWNGNKIIASVAREITSNTRLLMETKFKVTVGMQLDMEEQIAQLEWGQTLDCWWLRDAAPKEASEFYARYVKSIGSDLRNPVNLEYTTPYISSYVRQLLEAKGS